MAIDEKQDKKVLKKKKKHPIRTFFSLVAILIACFLTYTAGQEFLTTLQLKKDIADAQSIISELDDKQKEYETEKSNLENPDYVKRYARGKYMVSKDGEQVLKLPTKGEEENTEENAE